MPDPSGGDKPPGDRSFGTETPAPAPREPTQSLDFGVLPEVIDPPPRRGGVRIVLVVVLVFMGIFSILVRQLASSLTPADEPILSSVASAVAPPPPVPSVCASLDWRPAEGAIQSDLPEGAEGRFPLDAMTNCVAGVRQATAVRVWFTADGETCGLAVNTVEDRHAEVKACLKDRLVGSRVPALPEGDYAIMDVEFPGE